MLALMVGAALASADPSPDKKSAAVSADKSGDKKNKDVIAKAEEFGLIIGPVTEDIRKELNLR